MTPEEVAAGRELVDLLGEVSDLLAQLPLDVGQRRKLNDGARHLAESRRLFAELAGAEGT